MTFPKDVVHYSWKRLCSTILFTVCSKTFFIQASNNHKQVECFYACRNGQNSPNMNTIELEVRFKLGWSVISVIWAGVGSWHNLLLYNYIVVQFLQSHFSPFYFSLFLLIVPQRCSVFHKKMKY